MRQGMEARQGGDALSGSVLLHESPAPKGDAKLHSCLHKTRFLRSIEYQRRPSICPNCFFLGASRLFYKVLGGRKRCPSQIFKLRAVGHVCDGYVPGSDQFARAGAGAGVNRVGVDNSGLHHGQRSIVSQRSAPNQTVCYGYLARQASGEMVAVIRGANGFVEWVEDAMFAPIPYAPQIALPAGSGALEVTRLLDALQKHAVDRPGGSTTWRSGAYDCERRRGGRNGNRRRTQPRGGACHLSDP